MNDIAVVFLCCIAIAGCLLLVTMQRGEPAKPVKRVPLVQAVSMRAMADIAEGTPVYCGARSEGKLMGVVTSARLEKGVVLGDIVVNGGFEWKRVRFN